MCLKYQPEDEPPQMVETCSWLTYCFYKVVFLTFVNLLYLSMFVLCWFLAYGNYTFCDKYCGLV
jgi:hypothetical protein